jgi:hypothetical protein
VLHAARFDVAVSDVRAQKTKRDALGVAPEAPLGDDVRQVADVCDVVDSMVCQCAAALLVSLRP